MTTIETEVTTLLAAFDGSSEENVLKLTTLRNNYDAKLAEVTKLDDKIVEGIADQTAAETELEAILTRVDLNNAIVTKADFYLKGFATTILNPYDRSKPVIVGRKQIEFDLKFE